jgi:peroxiredoxin
MVKVMFCKRLPRCLFGVSLVYVLLCVPGVALSKLPYSFPAPGSLLPDFSLPVPPNDADKTYLNVMGKNGFRAESIAGDVLLIEILSMYCAACQAQAPYMNELYRKIEKDPELKHRIKMIGIGAGNSDEELAYYRSTYEVPFPLFPDPDFTVHNLMGAPRTPLLIFARPDGQGRLFVVDTHLGWLKDSDKLLVMVRKADSAEVPKVAVAPKEEWSREVDQDLALPISEDELMKKVRQALSSAGEEPTSIEKLVLPDLGTVYVGAFGTRHKRVFARLVARRVPCVDCHNVFFLYSFDDEGSVLGFLPIHITKKYNREWDETDTNKIRGHFLGKSICKEMAFDPKVDAVTSATISSKVVFDSFNKTHLVYQRLLELGYITKKNS